VERNEFAIGILPFRRGSRLVGLEVFDGVRKNWWPTAFGIIATKAFDPHWDCDFVFGETVVGLF